MNDMNQHQCSSTTPPATYWMQHTHTLANKVTSTEPKTLAIGTREREHHLFVRKTSQRYGRTLVGNEHTFIYWLLRAEKLVEAIERSDCQPYELISNAKGQPHHRLTKIGDAVFNICKTYDEAAAEHYERHRFSPPLALILEVVKEWWRELSSRANRNGDPIPNDQRTREILTSAVATIRAKICSQDYRDAVDNYKRNEEKNIASCCEYMAAQFQRRSQLLILRIDLYFRSQFKDWGYTREADMHYARFLRALREGRIIQDVLGYISKREDGIDRGIHFHALIVVDGHKHRDAANLTRLIGEEWVRRCGHGDYNDGVDVGETGKKDKGSYFNCYARLDQYRFNCLGLIHPTDADKLRGLRLAIEYLCKETSQLKPSPPAALDGDDGNALTSYGRGIRNLRKGIMPKGHSGRGAPRSSGLDTSAINRELLKK